jgi:hypothetical protein
VRGRGENMLQAGDSFKLYQNLWAAIESGRCQFAESSSFCPLVQFSHIVTVPRISQTCLIDVLFGDKNENTGVVGLLNLALSCNILQAMFSKGFYCNVTRNTFPFHMCTPVKRASGNALNYPPPLSQTRTVFSAVAPIVPNMNAWMFGVRAVASPNLIDFHSTTHSMTYSITSMTHRYWFSSFDILRIRHWHFAHFTCARCVPYLAYLAYLILSVLRPDSLGQRPAEWDPTALTTIALASGSGGEVRKGRTK